jgi:hypothetical protein
MKVYNQAFLYFFCPRKHGGIAVGSQGIPSISRVKNLPPHDFPLGYDKQEKYFLHKAPRSTESERVFLL